MAEANERLLSRDEPNYTPDVQRALFRYGYDVRVCDLTLRWDGWRVGLGGVVMRGRDWRCTGLRRSGGAWGGWWRGLGWMVAWCRVT